MADVIEVSYLIKRWRWGQYRFSISAAKVVDVKGVNSNVGRHGHVLMWDFDDSTEDEVKHALIWAQKFYKLPTIRVAQSGKSNHWIAICLYRLRFRETMQIMASTPGVDLSFIKYGIYRGHWTLRLSPKHNRVIRFAYMLFSNVPENVNPPELNSFVHFESTSRS